MPRAACRWPIALWGLLWCVCAPERASADALVVIQDFIVCRFYVPEANVNPGKVYVSFTQPNRVPAAIRSISVQGPEGFAFTFEQAPLSFWNLNGYHRVRAAPGLPPDAFYIGFTWQPMPDGLYTVTVVDVAGNVMSRSRAFRDGSRTFLPKIESIDAAEFRPADGEWGVSSTPTISWGIAEGEHLYYLLRVRDRFRLVVRDDIFENGTGLNKRSLAIPAGVLEPGTPYNWNVEVCDSDLLDEINNCAWLPTFHFTTAR